TTLDGTGETVLGGIYNYIGSSTTNKTLTIGADQTLRGGGLIGSSSYGEVDVVNKGTVVADNGTLYTYGSTFNNAAGEIQVSSGAALYVQKGMLNGGSISGAGTLTGSGTFQDVHYSGGLNVSGGTIQGGHIDDTLTVTNGGYVSMAGTITNDGTFKLASTNSLTRLMLAGDTTLDGTGETVLAESTTTSAAVLQVTPLTIGSDQTARVAGPRYGNQCQQSLDTDAIGTQQSNPTAARREGTQGATGAAPRFRHFVQGLTRGTSAQRICSVSGRSPFKWQITRDVAGDTSWRHR
ncbi:MAG: hypothetical protein U1F42_11470, partial [Candidatus Competibacteraceae bacterium]